MEPADILERLKDIFPWLSDACLLGYAENSGAEGMLASIGEDFIVKGIYKSHDKKASPEPVLLKSIFSTCVAIGVSVPRVVHHVSLEDEGIEQLPIGDLYVMTRIHGCSRRIPKDVSEYFQYGYQVGYNAGLLHKSLDLCAGQQGWKNSAHFLSETESLYPDIDEPFIRSLFDKLPPATATKLKSAYETYIHAPINRSVIFGDLHEGNMHWEDQVISGIFDFSRVHYSRHRENEFMPYASRPKVIYGICAGYRDSVSIELDEQLIFALSMMRNVQELFQKTVQNGMEIINISDYIKMITKSYYPSKKDQDLGLLPSSV